MPGVICTTSFKKSVLTDFSPLLRLPWRICIGGGSNKPICTKNRHLRTLKIPSDSVDSGCKLITQLRESSCKLEMVGPLGGWGLLSCLASIPFRLSNGFASKSEYQDGGRDPQFGHSRIVLVACQPALAQAFTFVRRWAKVEKVCGF